jgi:hypothetical protein
MITGSCESNEETAPDVASLRIEPTVAYQKSWIIFSKNIGTKPVQAHKPIIGEASTIRQEVVNNLGSLWKKKNELDLESIKIQDEE